MKYGEINLGQVEAIINKLGGEQGALRFLRGELVVSAAKPIEMPVWKTVKLGTKKTPSEYREALKSAGRRRASDWGDEILGRITCSKEEIDLDFVELSVADLGFKGCTQYTNICTRAQEFGFELCPAEVGPALRLEYGDQPNGEWLYIAIEAISCGGLPSIFRVGCVDGDLWLDGCDGRPFSFWDAGDRFVFGCRK